MTKVVLLEAMPSLFISRYTSWQRTRMQNPYMRPRVLIVGFVAGALLGAFGTFAALPEPQVIVSQKGRQFTPGEVSVKRGETVVIANDDGDLRHHAYVDTLKFRFDSGDQEPGTSANIVFPVAGDFDVLCAIHPKMKLLVHVQ